MNSNRPQRLLPPRGLLVSILLQVPLAVRAWPVHPSLGAAAGALALAATGIVLNLDASARFKARAVGICPFSPAPVLVKDGSFRFTRNPMYLGLVLVSAAFAIVSGAPWNLVFPAIYAGWLHQAFILPEEAFLMERHGEAFLRYAACRSRWIGLAFFRKGCGRQRTLPA